MDQRWPVRLRRYALHDAPGPFEQPPSFTLESGRLGTLVLLHLGSACLWKLDRGRGLNEVSHSFLCSKSPARLPTWRTRSCNDVKVQYKNAYKANEMRGRGLEIPHNAQ